MLKKLQFKHCPAAGRVCPEIIFTMRSAVKKVNVRDKGLSIVKICSHEAK
jgi:hypothetical protein